MTTKDEKAPTAGDVKQHGEAVRAAVTGALGPDATFAALDSLASLLEAALLGVQVPELVADNAALEKAVRIFTENSDREGWTQWLHDEGCRFDPSDDERTCTCDGSFNVGRVDAVLASPHPGSSPLAEHAAKVSALQARLDEKQGELVAARTKDFGVMQGLQARVADLEDRADERRQHLLDIQDAKHKVECERDALRAQLAEEKQAHTDDVQALEESNAERRDLRAKLEDCRTWIRNMSTEHGGVGFPCSLMDDEPAIMSAPHAEEKKVPIGDITWCTRASERENGAEVAVSPPAGPEEAGNVCEHGDHAAPEGQRFCSVACMQCEHTQSCGCPVEDDCEHTDAGGCAGLCNRDDDGNLK